MPFKAYHLQVFRIFFAVQKAAITVEYFNYFSTGILYYLYFPVSSQSPGNKSLPIHLHIHMHLHSNVYAIHIHFA